MYRIRNVGRVAKKYRLEALNDAVIAIVMTILVIELAVPEVPRLLATEQLHLELFEMWPRFLAYVLSFLVLGTLWSFHHILFTYIKRVDSKYTWLNILFLMFVALIPFSTAMIGEYTIFTSTPMIFYGVNAFVIMLMLNLMWWHATKNRLLVDKNIKSVELKQIKISLIIAVGSILVAIGLSFISTYIGVVMYFLPTTNLVVMEILISDIRHSMRKKYDD